MGHFLRPKATVLPESALIPKANLLEPPPERFTHEVKAAQPYYYGKSADAAHPDGTFEAGAKVAVLGHDRRPLCRVADARGLSVFTAFEGLAALP